MDKNKVDWRKKYDDMYKLKEKAQVWAATATIIAILFIVIWITALDNIDVDDSLGPYMCKQHGLEFVDVETNMGLWMDYSDWSYLKISCREHIEEEVDDGYLVIVE